jgi:hypothetical protein
MRTKLFDFILKYITLPTLVLAGLLIVSAIVLWMMEISLLYPGPSLIMAMLAVVIGFVGGIAGLKREEQGIEKQKSLPCVTGLEILVNRWQKFMGELNEDDSAAIYNQLFTAQQAFAEKDLSKIAFKKAYSGNKPKGGAFLVQPENRPVQVLKFDRLENIRNEWICFNQYVKGRFDGFVPGEPITYWPPQSEWDRITGNEYGAIVYQLATLGSEPQTLGEYYAKKDFSSVEEVLKKVLEVMDKHWWKYPIQRQEDSRDLNYEYKRLRERQKLSLMEDGLRETLAKTDKLEFSTDQQHFYLKDDPQKTQYRNPLVWVKDNFDRICGLLDTPNTRRDSIVHGDFHAGNILVEEDRGQPRIWLIDFPHTHVGPTVQDIARLEADIKFGLLQEDSLEKLEVTDIPQFEESLLPVPKENRPYLADLIPNQWPGSLQENSQLKKAWHAVNLLRRETRIDPERNYMAGDDARPYYLALLHATLPTLYYRDRSPWQKLYAFISAALLCERLGKLKLD